MNYRLTDVGPYPMQMQDCARGLQTIRHRAEEFNIDPERIGLMGGSAGSGISQWLAFHEDLAEPHSPDPVSRQSTRVRCAVPYAAQCSYDPRFISRLFDTDQVHDALPAFYGMDSKEDVSDPRFFPLYEDASPITHLSADDPPIFLYYSQANEPLPRNSSGREHIHHPKFGFHLKEKMDALGIECTLRLREQSPRFPDEEVVEFFVRHLGTK
jgi:acetyl esterase/lipase